MWLGIDDTDSPRGGCTTYALTEVLEAVRSVGADLIGLPRLVRLNPNVPWKTRGNAALSARIGRGRGRPAKVGELPGGPLLAYPRDGGLPAPVADRAVDAAWAAVLRSSRLGEEGTDPVLVAARRPLPAALYREAVSSVVPVEAAEAALHAVGADVRVFGSRRGLVGAAAAISWPARRATFELIAYRSPAAAGTPRRVEARDVVAAEARHPELFLCHDARTRRILVTPHTPCPILFGIRATRAGVLPRAFQEIRSEPPERWVVFRTNQGSGDHLVRRRVAGLRPFDAGRVAGVVTGVPRVLAGGHARFQVRDASGALDCLAFEPTKGLARVAGSLLPGDRVEVLGGRGEDATFRVEALVLRRLVPRRPPGRPPRCDACGRRSRSMGRGRGYRCPSCRARWAPEAGRGEPIRPTFGAGTYHPTPSARRHLHPIVPRPG